MIVVILSIVIFANENQTERKDDNNINRHKYAKLLSTFKMFHYDLYN